jgi:hypothetical protein
MSRPETDHGTHFAPPIAGRSGGTARQWLTRLRADRERLAIYLMILFLLGWLFVMFTIQVVVSLQDGVGLPPFQHQHVPSYVVEDIGVGNNLQKMMNATNKP